jgi:hypothetical protein
MPIVLLLRAFLLSNINKYMWLLLMEFLFRT